MTFCNESGVGTPIYNTWPGSRSLYKNNGSRRFLVLKINLSD